MAHVFSRITDLTKTQTKNMLTSNDSPVMASTIVTVELRGVEYCKVSTLAKAFDMGIDSMKELVNRLAVCQGIRVLTVGERLTLVNLADFHRALVACVPMRNGLAKSLDD